MQKRDSFSSRLGFVLAAAGSAVGLGNIWRFPYLAARNGGGIFILVYIFFVVTIGFSLMTTEISIGRKTRLSPVGAFRALSKKWTFVGVLAVFSALVIVSYYSVIGGWVTKYAAHYFFGLAAHYGVSENFFTEHISRPIEPVIWQLFFVAVTACVLLGGVKRGIERINKVLMPILVVISIAIAIYSMTLPGAEAGIKYLLLPDFSKFSVKTVTDALGQTFYSMSLASGIMLTYGSYVDKSDDIEKSVFRIELFDTFIAICAGLMIVPAVFAFSGGTADNLDHGPGLVFETLPKVFESMHFGNVTGALFFIFVLFAALTSAISIMEVVVSSVCDIWGFSRKVSTFIVAAVVAALGIPASLGYGVWQGITILGQNVLDFMDFATNTILLPLSALCMCILIGWVRTPSVVEDEVMLSSEFRRRGFYKFIIKYLAPVLLVVILLSAFWS